MTKNEREIERLATEAQKMGLSYGRYVAKLQKKPEKKPEKKSKRRG